MPLFPAVAPGANNSIFFFNVWLSDGPAPGRQYTQMPDDDDMEIGIRVDAAFSSDVQTAQSILAAIACSTNRSGKYLSTNMPRSANLRGASCGLAAMMAMCFPNEFEDVAFTGFVSPGNGGTCVVHDVDNVPLKIEGAIQQRVKLIVPWSEAASNFSDVGTANDFMMHGRLPNNCIVAAAYTALEALFLAKVLVTYY